MTDEKLLHELRNSKGWPTLGNAAADRIEELSNCVAVLEAKLAGAVAECERIGRLWHDAEAKLAKALEALGLADAALSGANMNMRVVERKVKAAIREGGE